MPLLNLDAFIIGNFVSPISLALQSVAYGSSAPVLYFCNAQYRSAFRTQFGHRANQVTAAARINEQLLIVLHRQPIKIPEGIIGNVLNSLSQQHTNAQPETAQTGRDEASIIAGRDEASAAARGVRDEALINAGRDEA
uniref:Glyco_transf_41 domain-containing protein n=1 Tax=Globodera pallida TaxID=36090 RepID=A0A183BZD5_GLOPA